MRGGAKAPVTGYTCSLPNGNKNCVGSSICCTGRNPSVGDCTGAGNLTTPVIFGSSD